MAKPCIRCGGVKVPGPGQRYSPTCAMCRFTEKFVVKGDHWMWTGAMRKGGYGSFYFEGKTDCAHRAAWKLHRGPIPEGYHIDHKCRIRLCVNPECLEPVTQAENNRRASKVRSAGITHCPQGHEYSEANTIRYGGSRYCRACGRVKRKAASDRVKALR